MVNKANIDFLFTFKLFAWLCLFSSKKDGLWILNLVQDGVFLVVKNNLLGLSGVYRLEFSCDSFFVNGGRDGIMGVRLMLTS